MQLALNRDRVSSSTYSPHRKYRVPSPAWPLVYTICAMTPVVTPTMTEGRCYIMYKQISAVQNSIATLLQYTGDVHCIPIDLALVVSIDASAAIFLYVSWWVN